MTRLTLLLSIVLVGLSACAAVELPSPPEAVATFASVGGCQHDPMVAGAVSLTPASPVARIEKRIRITATSPCLITPSGSSTPYAVFALPTTGQVASISAGGVFEARRVLAPVVFTAGANGKILRSFGMEAMRHRGQTLSIIFVPRPEEKLVIVSVERSIVGKAFSFLSTQLAPDQALAEIREPPVIGGYPSQYAKNFSLEGEAFARAYFADPKQLSDAEGQDQADPEQAGTAARRGNVRY